MTKKMITLVMLLLVYGVSFGQFCEDFDQYSTTSLINGTNGNNGTIISQNLLDNWGTICSSIAYYDANSQNGAGDNYLYLDDGPCSNGASWAFNSTDYSGDWINMVQGEGCFCYDFRTFHVQSGTIGGNSLRIYDGSGPTNSTLVATFVLNIPIDASRGWVRICAPIDFADTSGNLPSNSDGQWVINTANAADWDTLIQNVSGIAYAIDVASGNELFGIDNICISPDCDSTFTTGEPNNEGAFCCEGENLVENGNFENGANGFTSDYTEDPSVYPGAYTVSDNASIFGANIRDHSACEDPDQFSANTDYLLVNGRTTQPAGTTSVIWEQNIIIDHDKSYKFCANFKNMPQCTFDIVPQIQLEVNGVLYGWQTINTNSHDPCDWQQISECFEKIEEDRLNIKIHLKEDGLGDGNDLAIDDISLQAKLDQNLSITVQHQGNPQQLTGSVNSINNTDDTLLIRDECRENAFQYYWFVYELAAYPLPNPNPLDFSNMVANTYAWSGNIGGFNNQLPTSANPAWPLTTTFPNYVFDQNKLYVIGLFVPS
jgi:hypothetical protein